MRLAAYATILVAGGLFLVAVAEQLAGLYQRIEMALP